MRRMKRDVVISIFALGLGLAATAQAAPHNTQAEHPRWQQFCDDVSNVIAPTGKVSDFNSRLKQLGNDGWELTGMSGNLACYKRAWSKALPAEPVAWLPLQAPARAPIKAIEPKAVAEDPAPVAAPPPVVATPAPVNAAPVARVVIVKPTAVEAKTTEVKAEPKPVALTAPAKPAAKTKPVAVTTTTIPASAKTPAKPHTQVSTSDKSDDDAAPAPAPGARRALVPKS
jgi:hypothetical protein